MKIRSKIFLNFFLVSLFSLAVVSGSIYYFGHNIIIENIAGYNYFLAQNDIDSVDRFIDRRLEQWQVYVKTNIVLQTVLVQSNEEFAGMDGREEFIKAQDSAWQNSEKTSITSFMKDILENSLSDGLRAHTAFYEAQTGYNIFPEFFITNKYGALVAATSKTSDYMQADEDWWQKAKTEGVWVSDVSLDDSSGIYNLAFCIRVDDKKGDFMGVAKIIYDIRDVFKIVDSAVNPLVDNAGALGINFTRQTVNASLLNKDGKLIYSVKDGFGDLVDYPYLSLIREVASVNKKPYFIAQKDGAEKLFSQGHSRGYSDFKGLDWLLVVEKDTGEALAPLVSLAYWLVISVLLVFGVVIILSLWLSYSFSKPIKKLMKEVERVEGGDLNVKISALGHDEIGQLARAFNDMVVAVKISRREVDKKVAAQTVEIKQKALDLEDKQKAILNILDDVETERDRATRERDKVDIILHSIGDGVFVVDKDYKVIVFNGVAEKISGFGAKEVIGKRYDKILKFVFEKDEKINDEFVRRAIESGSAKQMSNHTVIIRKDGQRVPVADSAAPIKDKSGEIAGCVVVFRDVTREREIDTMKSEFVSVASHQLRTPLTGIKWFTEFLLKSKLSAKTKDYVKQISTSNERMVRLVDDLLNVSRIETGRKFDIVLKDTDIVPIIKSVVKEQTLSAEQKHIALVCSADAPDKLILPIDELKIRQVFQNLINNAIKYSKDKTKVIIGCQQKKNEVIFFVKDNGVGIPEHQQSRVFTKFFRAENILTMHTDGTGLGLYIVKAIAEAHGGKVWFESAENKGTTFFFSLPAKSNK